MYGISLKNTTYFDFGREMWITIYDNDYSQLYLSGFCVQA